LEVIICDTQEAVADRVANYIKYLINKKENATLGLATGSTPIKLYKKLIELYNNNEVTFKKTTTFNLDEYYNIDGDNIQSYRYFMNKYLFNKIDIDIDKSKAHFLICLEGENPNLIGDLYEKKIINAGGIDLQILGLGSNGHIGFNEPSSSFMSKTRIKTLTQKTIDDNSRLFNKNEYQPNMAMTMGISTILNAKYIILIATGENKSDAVNRLISGAISSKNPASILQNHKNVIVILDEDASSKVNNIDYYLNAAKENKKLQEQFGYFHELK
tara:strand:+ start:13737 stop:14552 length:816 start_codon:yes stop_codon:yes gene_type:complete